MSTESVNLWRINTKIRIVEAFGGKCGICGYNKCNASLALHHINPTEKEFSFNKVRANPKSWDKIVVELRKCAMLCHNCHSEVHDGITHLPNNVTRFDESYAKYKETHTNVHLCPICNTITPDWKNTCSAKCSAKYSHINRMKWDSIDLPKLLETYTANEIANMYNCSNATIYKRKNKIEYNINKQRTCDVVLSSIDMLSELSKYTYNELALKYNLTTIQLKGYVKRNKIDINNAVRNRKEKYIVSKDILMEELATKSIPTIAKEINVSPTYITRLVNKYNLESCVIIHRVYTNPTKKITLPNIIKSSTIDTITLDTKLPDSTPYIITIRKQDFDSIYPTYGWSSKLGKIWNMSSQAASRYCHRHFNIGNEHNRISKDDIINGFANKLSLKQIGELVGISGTTVSEYCKKYEINIPKYVFKVDWDAINLPELFKTKSITEIANELGITYTPVRNKAKALGLI